MSLIELHDITKEYQVGEQKVPALTNVHLHIEQGEFVSIMGTSGSGKSTLMNLLGCLDRPSSGVYRLHDVRVDSLDDAALSNLRNREIGFVFQSFHLLSDNNALQNIALPLVYRGVNSKTRKQMALQVAQRMGIGTRVKHRPNEISGGQAQRVAIARALLGAPRLILADEPTGNLDSKTGNEIMDIFLELHQQGHTIIMVTHDADLAQIAERIIHLCDGQVVKEEKTAKANNRQAATEHEQTGDKAWQQPNDDPKSGLRWLDLLMISIREGLFSHPLRTFLTMLGVLFGVAAVIAMVAINEGARQKAVEQIQQMGLHNIRVRSLQMTKDELREARKNLSMGLNSQDVKAVQSLPTIRYIAPIRYVNAEIARSSFKPKGQIIGTLPIYEKVANFYAERGRFIMDDDVNYYRRICILGRSIKQELFANEVALGQKIYLGSEIFTVVGIMESKNAPRGVVKAVSANDINHDVYIPLSTAKKRFNSSSLRNELDEISIMVGAAKEVQPTAQMLAEIISGRHHQVRDFEIVVPQELLRQERKTQEIFDIIMVCIASISLVVGGIGIMNIMLATVTERIREIGIRRAVGACMHDILKQFLVEATVISTAGGILGIVFGWSLTVIISQYSGWHTIVSAASIILGFGVSTMVGIVFGIYPAWKAALLDPIKALNTT